MSSSGFLEDKDLGECERTAEVLGVKIESEAARSIAKRSRGRRDCQSVVEAGEIAEVKK